MIAWLRLSVSTCNSHRLHDRWFRTVGQTESKWFFFKKFHKIVFPFPPSPLLFRFRSKNERQIQNQWQASSISQSPSITMGFISVLAVIWLFECYYLSPRCTVVRFRQLVVVETLTSLVSWRQPIHDAVTLIHPKKKVEMCPSLLRVPQCHNEGRHTVIILIHWIRTKVLVWWVENVPSTIQTCTSSP